MGKKNLKNRVENSERITGKNASTQEKTFEQSRYMLTELNKSIVER
jgi:hypothetical protein